MSERVICIDTSRLSRHRLRATLREISEAEDTLRRAAGLLNTADAVDAVLHLSIAREHLSEARKCVEAGS